MTQLALENDRLQEFLKKNIATPTVKTPAPALMDIAVVTIYTDVTWFLPY